MPSLLLRLLLLAVLCAGAARPAAAQEPTPMAQWQLSPGVALLPYVLPEVPKWQRVAAAGFVTLPAYEGSGRLRTIPVAAVEFRYRDIAYFSSSEGVGYNLLHGKGYRLGAALGYDIGRAERHDPQLAGLGDLKSAPEIKLYAEKVFFPVTLRSTAIHAFADEAGWTLDVAAYLPVAGNQHFLLLAGPSLAVADTDEMRRRFGVRADQAARSGLARYEPGSGLRHGAFGFSATWLIDEHWLANATGSAQKLLGPAAESPLTTQRTQIALLMILGYRW